MFVETCREDRKISHLDARCVLKCMEGGKISLRETLQMAIVDQCRFNLCATDVGCREGEEEKLDW